VRLWKIDPTYEPTRGELFGFVVAASTADEAMELIHASMYYKEYCCVWSFEKPQALNEPEYLGEARSDMQAAIILCATFD
jgi:hypothetical protein